RQHQPMTRPLSIVGWLLVFAAGAAAGVAGYYWLQRSTVAGEPHAHADKEPAEQEPTDPDVVTLADELVARAGITIGAPIPIAAGREQRLEGRIELDPWATVTLRAPASGTLRLRASPLRIGDAVTSNTVVADLVPRLSAVEQLDLRQRRQQAEVEVGAATSAAALATKNLARIEAVNRGEANVAEAVVEEATERVRQAELRRTAASRLLSTLTDDATTLPMLAPGAGTIVEIAAHDGEAIEAGQPMLRLANFEALLARLPLQPGVNLDTPPPQLRLQLVRSPERPLIATFVLLDGASVGTTQPALVYRLSTPPADLRPGDAVSAFLPLPGEAPPTFSLPPSAVFRHLGQAFVFVRTAASDGHQQFRRQRVEIVDWTGNDLHVTVPPPAPDDPSHLDVVTTGAVDLLSQELRGQAPEGG
ncbi:MAG: efflux RND transporter periplasmic adaptor subunit, partial [Planctomycetota bacterium]